MQTLSGNVSGLSASDKKALERIWRRRVDPHVIITSELATFLCEQQRSSPLLVLDMRSDPQALTALPEQTVGGKKLRAVRYDVSRYTFTVMFDPASGLPARVRSLDTEPIRGDLNYDLVLADWRPVNSVQFAHQLTWELDGKVIGKADVGKLVVNVAIPADRLYSRRQARLGDGPVESRARAAAQESQSAAPRTGEGSAQA